MRKKILIIFCTLVFFALIVMTAGNVGAKSLYTVASIGGNPTPMEAYDIQVNGSLIFQEEHGVPTYAGGAVGLAIDSDSAFIFVTYEFSNLIQLVDATTMTSAGSTTAPGASNLAGIVVDQDKGLLYTVDRWTDDLYIYDWDPANTTLTLQDQQNLTDLSSAFGIALDEINDVLYVADYSYGVIYYDTDTWAKLGNFTLSHDPISIAVDVANQLVYTGAGWGGSTLLSQYDMNTTQENTVDLGGNNGVMGVAVDPASTYLYCNVGYYAYSASTIRTFDSNLNQLHSTFFNYSSPRPTDLCIPGQDISYNPLNLTKDDGLEEEECVSPGENINYTICFDNLNDYNVTNVTLKDTLPANVSFDDASDGGTYDGVNHTVTWDLGTILSGEGDCIWLLVEVDSSIPPETAITNYVTIDSDETPPTTQSETTLTCNVTIDTTPPIQTLEFGNPKTYREWYGVNYTVLSCTTPIWINSTDPGGVGSSHINYSVWNTDDPYPNENGSIVTEMLYYKEVHDGDPDDLDTANGSISVLVYVEESCFHEIIYQCWDYNNNTDGHRDIDFIADCCGPNTLKDVGLPQYGDDYPNWVSCETPLWFNSTDECCLPNGTAVDYIEIKVWWKRNISDLNEPWKLNNTIIIYDGDLDDLNPEYGRISFEFHFDDDCGHEIWWRGVDIFGNLESWKKQKHKVDCTPPVTTKEIGEPKYYNQSENITYVTTSTTIWLNTTDGDNPCAVGCEYLHWEIWWFNESGEDWELIDGGNESDNQVEFTFTEECEHKIIWWAVDYLGNKEEEHVQFHKVDDTPPETIKEIGEPKYHNISENITYVTTSTSIWLNTTDQTEPCAVGCEYLWWEIYVLDEWMQVFLFVDSGIEYSNQVELTFSEECHHRIRWGSVDYLGNVEETHLQSHKVDDTPPIIEKDVGMPKYGEGLPPGDYFITSETPIWINATDDGPEPCTVGSVNLTVGIWYNETWIYYYDYVDNGTAQIGPITLDGECIHEMMITATDNLGNTAYHNETFYVDNTPPNITKIHPDPGFVPIDDINGGYLNCDEITLVAVDPGQAIQGNITEPLENETILESIVNGTAWLISQQNGDGSWGSSYKAAETGFVLIKLQDRAYELGADPFENDSNETDYYEYADNVIAGWKFLLTSGPNVGLYAQKLAIGMQTNGDPDSNGNGYGIYFEGGSRDVYYTGICSMAIAATGQPDRPNDGGLDYDTDGDADTYGEIAQEVADWLAMAQCDSGYGRGGWYYYAHNNGGSSADNSISGYATLGLASLEGFGSSVPQFVKDELDLWIDYIQCDTNGGSGYSSPCSWVNLLKTGNLIFEMTFVGDDQSTQRFQDAMDYIETHWHDQNYDPGWGYNQGSPAHYQAMYCLMKGFEYSGIDLIDLDGVGSPEHDWYEELSNVIVDQQNSDGSWPNSPAYYSGGSGYHWVGQIVSTCWNLLTLEKIAPPSPKTGCSSGVESIFWRYEWNGTYYPEQGDLGAVDGEVICEKYGWDDGNISEFWWYQINDTSAIVQFVEECEHDLYYFAKDNVYNYGPIHHQEYLVDCTPPDSWKWIEGPHYNASQEDITKFNLTTDDEINYFWLRDNDTWVYIQAEDNGTDPCIAGLDYIHIELWWDSDGDDIIDTNLWTEDVYFFIYAFQIMEDCLHEIRWYAVDILNNTEETHYQYHRVDSTPPETEKTFKGPTYHEDLNENGTIEPNEENYWVTSETEITITAIDQADPCAVGVAGFHVTIWWDSDCDDEVDTLLFDEDIDDPYNYTFTLKELQEDNGNYDYIEGLYLIGWNSTDHLGNEEEWTEQYHKVDDTAPHVIIFKPVDGWFKDGSAIPSVVFAEDLTNPHGPCDPGDDGAVGIADGKQGSGFLIDVFPNFDIIYLNGSNFIYNASSHEYIGNLVIPDPSGIPDGVVLFVANASDNLENGANSLIEILHALFMQSGGDEGLFEELILQFLINQNIVFIGIDNTPPSVTINEPEDGDEIGPDTVYISADVSDVLSGMTGGSPCYVTLNDVYLGILPYNNGGCEGTLPIPENMPSGDDLPLNVSAYDVAGNEGLDTVLVDYSPSGPPACAIISPENDTTHTGIIPVVIEANDDETDPEDLIVKVKTSRQYDPDFIFAATYDEISGYFYVDIDISKYTDGAKIILEASATDEDNNTMRSDWVVCWVNSTIEYDRWMANGWNLINLPPTIGCDDSIEKVLFSILGDFDWIFELNTWNNYHYGEGGNSLQHMEAMGWYWIHMDDTQERLYLDIYSPEVVIDDPEEGEVKEEMYNTNIFAYDDESWITDVYVEIYDQNDSLYYNGSVWQINPIWLPCYYVSGDEWGYITEGIWTNGHNYTMTAMAYDATGCSDIDMVNFAIYWPTYDIMGTVYYDGGDTNGTLDIALYLNPGPPIQGITIAGPIEFPVNYTFSDLAEDTYYVIAFLDINNNSGSPEEGEPAGAAINKTLDEGPDAITVDGDDEEDVDVTLLICDIYTTVIYPYYESIPSNETLIINGTAVSECGCLEIEDVLLALYYTPYNDFVNYSTYYWNTSSEAWENTTAIYNPVEYVSGGCPSSIIYWNLSVPPPFDLEGAETYNIHVIADPDDLMGTVTSQFTVEEED